MLNHNYRYIFYIFDVSVEKVLLFIALHNIWLSAKTTKQCSQSCCCVLFIIYTALVYFLCKQARRQGGPHNRRCEWHWQDHSPRIHQAWSTSHNCWRRLRNWSTSCQWAWSCSPLCPMWRDSRGSGRKGGGDCTDKPWETWHNVQQCWYNRAIVSTKHRRPWSRWIWQGHADQCQRHGGGDQACSTGDDTRWLRVYSLYIKY